MVGEGPPSTPLSEQTKDVDTDLRRYDGKCGRRQGSNAGKYYFTLFAFVSDDRSDAAPKEVSRDGFNVIRWRMGGLT
jgi:hypothetical protein